MCIRYINFHFYHMTKFTKPEEPFLEINWKKNLYYSRVLSVSPITNKSVIQRRSIMIKTVRQYLIPLLVFTLVFTSSLSSYAYAEVSKETTSIQAFERAKSLANMDASQQAEILGNIPDLKEKEAALGQALTYDNTTGKIILQKEIALQKYAFNETDLNGYSSFLKELTPEQTKELLTAYGIDIHTQDSPKTSGGISVQIAPIIWIGIIAIGVIAGGVIFTALYFNHQQKMTLINRCYDEGGSPRLDSRDSSGMNGTTNSGAASAANGYKFECIK